MTGLENAAYADLTALIQSTWPSVTEVIREEQIERANWANLAVSGSLVAPFAVVRFGGSEPDGWGLDNYAWRWSVTVTLVVALNDPNAALGGGGYDVTGYLGQQLAALRDALLVYSGTALQLAGETPALDATVRSETNQVFLGAQAPLQSGELRCRLLVGESPG